MLAPPPARRLLALLTVSLLTPALAGCAGLGAEDDPAAASAEAAPEWRAGYSWTYAADGGLSGSREKPFGGPWTETKTVVNTTMPIEGRRALHVSVKRNDSDERGAQYEGVDPATLTPFAYGREWVAYRAPGETAPPAECGGSADGVHYRVQSGGPGGPLAAPLRFPLRVGESWEGRLGSDDDAPSATYRVAAEESVTVPAGSFRALKVTVDGEWGDAGESARMEASFWFAPEVRNLVRAEMRWSMSAPLEGVGAVSAWMKYELTAYALEAGPERPITVLPDPFDVAAPSFLRHRMVVDRELPLDVSEGPVRVTFGLKLIPEDEQGIAYDGPEVVAVVPDSVEGVEGPHTVKWTVRRDYDLETLASGEGARFELDVAAPGRYAVEVEVTSVCPDPQFFGVHSTAYFEATWERTWDVPVESGGATTLDVAELDVAYPGMSGELEWTFARGAPGGAAEDQGWPVLVSPSGREDELSGSVGAEQYYFDEPGKWALRWHAAGSAPAGVNPFGAAPVVAGDDVTLTVRLR